MHRVVDITANSLNRPAVERRCSNQFRRDFLFGSYPFPASSLSWRNLFLSFLSLSLSSSLICPKVAEEVVDVPDVCAIFPPAVVFVVLKGSRNAFEPIAGEFGDAGKLIEGQHGGQAAWLLEEKQLDEGSTSLNNDHFPNLESKKDVGKEA